MRDPHGDGVNELSTSVHHRTHRPRQVVNAMRSRPIASNDCSLERDLEKAPILLLSRRPGQIILPFQPYIMSWPNIDVLTRYLWELNRGLS